MMIEVARRPIIDDLLADNNQNLISSVSGSASGSFITASFSRLVTPSTANVNFDLSNCNANNYSMVCMIYCVAAAGVSVCSPLMACQIFSLGGAPFHQHSAQTGL